MDQLKKWDSAYGSRVSPELTIYMFFDTQNRMTIDRKTSQKRVKARLSIRYFYLLGTK